jgi:hypothetical protein
MKRTYEQEESWLARRMAGPRVDGSEGSRKSASGEFPAADERQRPHEPSDGEMLQRIEF